MDGSICTGCWGTSHEYTCTCVVYNIIGYSDHVSFDGCKVQKAPPIDDQPYRSGITSVNVWYIHFKINVPVNKVVAIMLTEKLYLNMQTVHNVVLPS